jgi:hypothetical protein
VNGVLVVIAGIGLLAVALIRMPIQQNENAGFGPDWECPPAHGRSDVHQEAGQVTVLVIRLRA